MYKMKESCSPQSVRNCLDTLTVICVKAANEAEEEEQSSAWSGHGDTSLAGTDADEVVNVQILTQQKSRWSDELQKE